MSRHETRLEKRTRMFALIETYRSSGQTQKEFCLDNNINYSSFQFWLKQYRLNNRAETHENRLSSKGFMPIKISPDSAQNHFGFQIEYPNGIRIQMNTVPDIHLIRALLAPETI